MTDSRTSNSLLFQLRRVAKANGYYDHIAPFDAEIERLQTALQTIIGDSDYTAPEGMTRIAKEALAGSSTLEPRPQYNYCKTCDCVDCGNTRAAQPPASEPPDDGAVRVALHADHATGESMDTLALKRLAEAVRAAPPPSRDAIAEEATVLLTRYRDSLGGCVCMPCPQCQRAPRDCDGTDCAATCDCRECNYCRAVALLAELRAAKPPAPDEDTERLLYVMRMVSGKALRDAWIEYSAGDIDSFRIAIDNARSRQTKAGE